MRDKIYVQANKIDNSSYESMKVPVKSAKNLPKTYPSHPLRTTQNQNHPRGEANLGEKTQCPPRGEFKIHTSQNPI